MALLEQNSCANDMGAKRDRVSDRTRKTSAENGGPIFLRRIDRLDIRFNRLDIRFIGEQLRQ
jgi:hypothetical protein